MFAVNQNKTRKSWHIVDVRVLFWSITNMTYWEKILGITLLTQKIALPFYVMLILHLVIYHNFWVRWLHSMHFGFHTIGEGSSKQHPHNLINYCYCQFIHKFPNVEIENTCLTNTFNPSYFDIFILHNNTSCRDGKNY